MNHDYNILHFINNYSGANRYSLELIKNQIIGANNLNIIFIYLYCNHINEFEIELVNGNIVAKFPYFQQGGILECDKILKIILNSLSLAVEFKNNIIIHDNSVVDIDEKCKTIQNKTIKFITTLHCVQGYYSTEYLAPDVFDRVICVTRYAQDYIDRTLNIPSHLIYNGVSEILPTISRGKVWKRYGFSADEVLVLYVGRIEESKGVGFLAKVFSDIGRSDIRLVVVGDGSYNMVFEQIKANHAQITFTGKIDNQEVHNLMAACDIGVIPSLNEQCSYVALEMMSHGMAIIASEVRGMGELFVGKDIALTVPVDYTEEIPTLDTDVLKQHITTLAKDGELRKRLGERARQEWTEHYTAQRMARETMDVYRELAAQF